MKRLIVCSILVLSITRSFAKDYLAATPDEAMLLLQKAKAGDRVLLKDGNYTDITFHFHNDNGTEKKPVTFAAEHSGKVFFEGNSTFSFSGQYIIIEGLVWQHGGNNLQTRSVFEFKNGNKPAVHSSLRNSVIDSYNNSDLNSDNKWVSLYGEYNRVEHCLLYNKLNKGATLTVWLEQGKAAHHVVAWNYFLERQNGPNADNGLESIRVGDSKTSMTDAHCVVAFNRFENCDGEIEIISNKSCHNSYLHNTFYNSNGGLTLRHGNNCVCDGNYFDGGSKPDAYGIRMIGEGHEVINNYFTGLKASKQMLRAPVTIVNGIPNSALNGYFQVKNAVVAGNFFDNCALPCLRMGARTRTEATLPPDSVQVFNNIFVGDGTVNGNVYDENSRGGFIQLRDNLVVGISPSQALPPGFTILKVPPARSNIVTPSKSAGANLLPDDIAVPAKKYNYKMLAAIEVGPLWKQQ